MNCCYIIALWVAKLFASAVHGSDKSVGFRGVGCQADQQVVMEVVEGSAPGNESRWFSEEHQQWEVERLCRIVSHEHHHLLCSTTTSQERKLRHLMWSLKRQEGTGLQGDVKKRLERTGLVLQIRARSVQEMGGMAGGFWMYVDYESVDGAGDGEGSTT